MTRICLLTPMQAQALIGFQSRGMHVIDVEGSGCREVLNWFLEQNLRVQLLPRYYYGEVFCLFVMFAQSELADAERRASGDAYLMFRLAWRSPEKGVEWIEHSYPGTRLRSWRDP